MARQDSQTNMYCNSNTKTVKTVDSTYKDVPAAYVLQTGESFI